MDRKRVGALTEDELNQNSQTEKFKNTDKLNISKYTNQIYEMKKKVDNFVSIELEKIKKICSINTNLNEIKVLKNKYDIDIIQLKNDILKLRTVMKKITDQYINAKTNLKSSLTNFDRLIKFIDEAEKYVDSNEIMSDTYNMLKKISNSHSKHSKLDEKVKIYQEKKAIFNYLLNLSSLINSVSSNENICTICREREINTTLIPCGHVACMICFDKLEDDRCCLCNKKYNFKQKIYL